MRRLRNVVLALLGIAALFAVGYLFSTAVPCAVPPFPAAADPGRWEEVAAMPTARSELAAAALDGRIYVAGGLRGASVTDAFEVYDPAADAWQAAAPLPRPLHHLALAALDGRIYAAGGFGDLAFREASAAVWAYDPAADSWAPRADLPAARGAHTMAAIDGRLYLVGGVPDATALWVYDPAADAWQTGLAPMPTPREHLGSAVISGRLVLAGGRWAGVGNVDALEAYDPAADAWEPLPAMPSARGGLTAAALGDRLYVGGGEDPWGRLGTGCTYATVEVYEATAVEWQRLDDLPQPRHGLASAVVDGRWFIVGGGTRPTAGTVISTTGRTLRYSP